MVPRVALSMEQRMDYKLRDFKGWVIMQMKLNHKTQKEVGKALGVSQSKVSQMLKVPKDGKEERKVKKDPFTYGQVLTLCEFFGVDEKEKQKLFTF